MDKLKELFGFRKGDPAYMILLNWVVLIAGGIAALAKLIFEFFDRKNRK